MAFSPLSIGIELQPAGVDRRWVRIWVLDRQPAADGRPLDPALRDYILLITFLVAFLEATAQQLRPIQPSVVMGFGRLSQ